MHDMTMELSLAAAFVIGLLGSTHCIGMCGGIVGALTMGLPDRVRQSTHRLLPYLLVYNSGRLLSYGAAGFIIGLATATAGSFFQMRYPIGGIVGGLFMIALGIYIGGWFQTMVVLERAGAVIWRRIEPLGRKLMPVQTLPHALGLGLLWGWLPCGLVYSTLAWSATAASAAGSAMLMLAFGVGTLPMLMVIGGFAHKLQAITQNRWTRYLAGVLLILFGVMILFKALSGGHHHH